MLKQPSTFFLKGALCVIGAPVIAISVIMLSWILRHDANPLYATTLYTLASGILLSVLPFCVALFQAYCLLTFIDKQHAFSEASVHALKRIKQCAFVITAIYLLLLPFVFMLAQLDDAPGLVILGCMPAFGALTIAVFAAVLQRLLHQAIYLQTEHDLTV